MPILKYVEGVHMPLLPDYVLHLSRVIQIPQVRNEQEGAMMAKNVIKQLVLPSMLTLLSACSFDAYITKTPFI